MARDTRPTMALPLLLLAAGAQALVVLPTAPLAHACAAARARPALMVTIDNRRGDRPKQEPENKYGLDPRENKGDGSGSTGPWEHVPGTVGDLDSVAQLTDVVEKAEVAKRFISLKFRRDGCAACASTEKSYEATAKE